MKTFDEPRVPRLIIIDDDEVLRTIAATTLRDAGFDVVEAEDGIEGLGLMEHSPFDLLLLDVMMPALDGYEVCRRLRQTGHGANVPVLMLTGLNDSASVDLAYAAGATDFISKPINWTLLSHRVRYALRAGGAVNAERRSRERLERAQCIANMGSWGLSADGHRFVCSPELAQVLAAPDHAVRAARPQDFLDLINETDREAVSCMRDAARLQGQPYQRTFEIRRFDGVTRTVYEQAVTAIDSNGHHLGVEGITQDITDRVEAEKRAFHLAHYDALTGLPNRQFFNELVSPALERFARLRAGCAMLYIDIDRFKSINDAVGYAQGDAVLCLISARVKAFAHGLESLAEPHVMCESVVSRVGPNAFALFLTGVGDQEQASRTAEQLLAEVAAPMRIDDRELVLSASIGVALFPRDGSDAGALIQCAEQASHTAKAAGRGRYRFFDETINKDAGDRLTRENELRRAITENQLCLYYQPKVDADRGTVIGAEALVRWQHPQKGMVPPGEFIPLAEESGLILPLTDWLLERACSDLRHRMDMGLRTVPVSVNLSSPSFATPGLRSQLEELMARHALSPAYLVLEVTESLLMSDVELAVDRLRELRDMGFKVSLDDFGTGYSSLGYLKRFPIDELKIDRSFVTDAWRGGRDGAIAMSVIALGRAFNLRVVAEGVETPAQAEFLLAHGCAYQQGFLFGKPMPHVDFNALLANPIEKDQ
ncbi:MAG: EAL domain-containing protein [Rubrivivax sp.]|nr:MAG: EAL domain-containing protein [Rubrivivax sp.]